MKMNGFHVEHLKNKRQHFAPFIARKLDLVFVERKGDSLEINGLDTFDWCSPETRKHG